MSKIENPKNYEGRELDTIFFRPMLSGTNADELGVKVMYNSPVPTTLQFWKRAGDILQNYTASGWNGGSSATKFQKTIEMQKVKAESGYSAEDYFNMVFEQINAMPEVNMDDLSGTVLEEAETALFKDAIAESIRSTMWLGDSTRKTTLNTFDGIVKRLVRDMGAGENQVRSSLISENVSHSTTPALVENLLKKVWNESTDMLKEFKSQGNLVYLVSSDIYAKYEEELDSIVLESAYLAKQSGREGLNFRGIPVVDMRVAAYKKAAANMPGSLVILTDKRNFALAVNTSDFPGTEVRMWYNPDMMENRQRAVFMAGCDYLLPELVSMAVGGVEFESLTTPKVPLSGALRVSVTGSSLVKNVTVQGQKAGNVDNGAAVEMVKNGDGEYTATIQSAGTVALKFTATCFNGEKIISTI